jgi:shikimate kinase
MDGPSFPEIIVIAGPKHSGKTSAGGALADFLKARFIDLDELIEQQTGKSPRTLYKEGPSVFRDAEAQALQSLLPEMPGSTLPGDGADGTVVGGAAADPQRDRTRRVLAAGGGLIDNPAALAMLERNGPAAVTVCLAVSAETAWDRINAGAKENGELPPFLNTENPRETHAILHRRREKAYGEWASITVQAEGKSAEAIGREIAALVCPRLPTNGNF